MAQSIDDPSSSKTAIIQEVDSDTTQCPTKDPSIYASKPSNGPWFTFDDILKSKWSARFKELSAWIDVQMIRSGTQLEIILKEFSSQFT